MGKSKKVKRLVWIMCAGLFFLRGFTAEAVEQQENYWEELREEEDADDRMNFDADAAMNRTAAKSALADMHGIFVFRDAFIEREQLVKNQQKQNYEDIEHLVLTKQQPRTDYEEKVNVVLNADTEKFIRDVYYGEDSREVLQWVCCIAVSICGLCIVIRIQDCQKQMREKRGK